MLQYIPILCSEECLAEKPSNVQVLLFAVVLFLIFVLAEIIGAIASNSISFLFFASAVSVDVICYFSSYWVEKMKRQDGFLSTSMRMILEVGVPGFSVLCLVVVTGYMVVDAFRVLHSHHQGIHPMENESGNATTHYLSGYSAVNLCMDLICASLLAWRGPEAFLEPDAIPIDSLDTSIDITSDEEFGHLEEFENLKPMAISKGVGLKRKGGISACIKCKEFFQHALVGLVPTLVVESSDAKILKNLNMLSAALHVGSDALRASGVLIATTIAWIADISLHVCLAWTSLLVGSIVFILVLPLLRSLVLRAKGNVFMQCIILIYIYKIYNKTNLCYTTH